MAKRWPVVLVALCLVATVAAVAYAVGKAKGSAAKPGLVKAMGFELVDEKGEVRGSLGVADGHSYLSLCDPEGHPRLGLTAGDDGSLELSMTDVSGYPRGGMTLRADGIIVLGLQGNGVSKKLRAPAGIMVSVEPDGSPHIQAADPDGKRHNLLGAPAFKKWPHDLEAKSPPGAGDADPGSER